MSSPQRALAVLAMVLSSCLASEYGWQPLKELTFAVQGQDLVGLPQLKPQYAGFHYQGELHVQTHSSRVLLLKLFNMNYTKIHEDLPQGWWKGPEASSRNKTRQLPITTSTIVVKLSKSASPELILQLGLDEWQINFIKGLVSHLLVYLDDNSPSGHYSNNLVHSQDRNIYSVIEDSVEGRCEVLYEISRLPKQVAPHNYRLCGAERKLWEITKTHNFSNCQVLNEDHAHLPSLDCPPSGGNCGQFWTRASLTQMVGCGEINNLVLLSSVSSSVKNTLLHLKKNSQAVVNSYVNITLISMLDLKTKFNVPQNKQTMQDLFYSYSTTPKENVSRSEEGMESNENVDARNQINPTKEVNKEFDKRDKGKGKSEFRNKREIKFKYNKYRTDSNEFQNNNSDEQPVHKKNSKRNPNKYGNRVFLVKSSEESNHKASEETNDFISEEKGNQYPRQNSINQNSNESNEQLSNESSNQPSEEMDLEQQWKISGKETKKNPPHQPFNFFALAHRSSYDSSCLKPKLRQIIDDITSDLKEVNILPEKNTMDKLSMAVDICRSLPLDQLSSVAEEVFEIHNGASNTMKSDQRQVFRDVVTICGTHPSFQLIKGWIERQQVEGEEAAQMIASLPSHILSPTKYLVEDFFELGKNIAEKDDQQLTTTVVLAMSNLVRTACVNRAFRQHRFSSIVKPVCDESFAARYVQWLSHKFSTDAPLRRAYIEALGNVGTPDVIEIFKSIAVNPKYSSYYRASAVFAMRYQVLRKNPEMAPLLMSLYHNYSLPTSVRIASAALLPYAEPGLAIWQRLAISTWYEPSAAVSQFVSSSIRNMANSKDSLYGYINKAAGLVQPLTRPSKISINQPFNMLTSWLSRDLEQLVLEQISWIQFSDYSNLYYRHSSRFSGFSRTNFETSFSISNQDELWTALKELIVSTNVHPDKSPVIGEMQEVMKLEPRYMPPLQVQFHVKINNMMERMVLINKETFPSIAKGGHKMVSEVLRQGKSLSYQKADMDNFHLSTTTAMGFPVEFSVRTPWIIRAKAELNATTQGLNVGTTFMYSAQMLSSVSLMSPWDKVAHMAGAYATNFVQLPPFHVQSTIDSASDSIKMKTTYIDQHRILYFNMQPFTSQRKIKVVQPTLLSPDTIPIKLGEPVQVPISWMSRILKTVYSSERTEHFSMVDFLRGVRGVVGFPLVMPDMEPRSFETVMNPVHPVTMNFSMSIASKSMGVLEFEPQKETLLKKVLSAVDKVMSLGQSSYMSAFRLFGWGEKSSSEETTSSSNEEPNLENSNSDSTGNNANDRANSNKSGKDDKNSSRTNKRPTSQEQNESKEPNLQNKTKSATNEVDVIVDSTSDSQIYKTTYESAVGSFNASQIDPFTNLVNGSSTSYLFDQVLSKINSGNAIVFAFDMQSAVPDRPVKLSAYITYASTFSKRASRLGIFVKKDQTQARMTAVHEDPIDISSDLKRKVTEDLQHNVFVDYIYMAPKKDFKAFVKVRLGVSKFELLELRSSKLLEYCSQGDSAIDFKCQQLRQQAQQISFGNMTVHYSDDAKYLERMVLRHIDAAKVMLPRAEEKSGEGFNTITMLFNVDQKTGTADAYVTSPVTSVKIHSLPLSKLPMSTLVEWATQPHAVSEYCGISPQRVRTFDGGDFTYNMKDNWHLVLHDQTRKYGLSVLARPSANNTMNIKVIKDDESVIRLEHGPTVYLNDKMQLLDTDHPLMMVSDSRGSVLSHTVYTPDNAVHMRLPYEQLDLVYTGFSVIIRAGAGLQGRLCGICGSYTNTGAEQFLAAHGEPIKSPAEYAASYELNSAGSQPADTYH